LPRRQEQDLGTYVEVLLTIISLERVQAIGPGPAHPFRRSSGGYCAALICSAHLIAFAMGELPFYSVAVKSHFELRARDGRRSAQSDRECVALKSAAQVPSARCLSIWRTRSLVTVEIVSDRLSGVAH